MQMLPTIYLSDKVTVFIPTYFGLIIRYVSQLPGFDFWVRLIKFSIGFLYQFRYFKILSTSRVWKYAVFQAVSQLSPHWIIRERE